MFSSYLLDNSGFERSVLFLLALNEIRCSQNQPHSARCSFPFESFQKHTLNSKGELACKEGESGQDDGCIHGRLGHSH